MSNQIPLYLHKSEWDSIKRNKNNGNKDYREEYLQKLNDISQGWIKSWPDTVQGIVHHVDEQKEAEEENKNKIINKHISKKILDEIKQSINSKTAIKRARDLIFENSSYGRQLLSAFWESKTFEERDAQIKFMKNQRVKENEIKPEKTFIDILKPDVEDSRINKEKEKCIALFNKATFDARKKQESLKKDNDKMLEAEDNKAIQKLLDEEKKRKTKSKLLEKDLEDFKSKQAEIKALKQRKEKEDNDKIELWRRYEDTRNRKIEEVYKSMHMKSTDYVESHYKLLEKMQNEKNQQVEEFIEKGVKKLMIYNKEKDKQNLKESIINREKRQSIDSENKKLAKTQQIDSGKYEYGNFLSDCRSDVKREKLKRNNDIIALATSSKPTESLKRREKEASSWNSLDAAHAQFTEHAHELLQECLYKGSIQKVINKYAQDCNLKSESLQISKST